MEEMTITGSQTVTSQTEEIQETQVEEQDTSLTDAFEAFGIPPKPEKETAETNEESNPPAKEEAKPEGEAKGIKVKYNKEERFVDESEIPDLVEKGLNLDKIRTQKTEIEKELDEAAILLGFKDRADFVVNREKLKEQQQQKKQQEETQLRDNLRQEAYDAGLDPDKVEAWLDNHPEVKEAKQIKETTAKQTQAQERAQRFNQLYAEFPELGKEIKEDGSASWYTAEMHQLVESGTPPLVAYRSLNMDKIIEQRTKQAEQKIIKDQRLGNRAQVETDIKADTEPSVDPELTSAFSMFGIPAKNAKKYAKK